MAEPLENLQAAYRSLCAKIAEIYANPKPSYSVDGVSKSWNEYRKSLLEELKALKEIPGVAPDTNPVFEVWA